MLDLRVSKMNRSLLSLQMVLRNQRPVLTSWNRFLLVLPCLGKRFCRTRKMTWWMIPHRSSYLMKAWVAKERLRQLRLHLRGWTENLFNLHQKRHVKLNWIYLFPLKFQWLRHDACQCWWHHRSLEARSRTSILQKTKLGHKNFN